MVAGLRGLVAQAEPGLREPLRVPLRNPLVGTRRLGVELHDHLRLGCTAPEIERGRNRRLKNNRVVRVNITFRLYTVNQILFATIY